MEKKHTVFIKRQEFSWKATIIFSNKKQQRVFPLKSCRLWHIKRYGRTRQATDDNTIRRMRFACWITKVTNTKLIYLLLLQCNNDQANASQCYVIWTLNVLFYSFDTHLVLRKPIMDKTKFSSHVIFLFVLASKRYYAPYCRICSVPFAQCAKTEKSKRIPFNVSPKMSTNSILRESKERDTASLSPTALWNADEPERSDV